MEGRILSGRYQLVRVIGRGGMGVVYEAIQLELARRVAIKVLLDLDERSIARFRQEALLVASLVHPNVVQVTDLLTNLDDDEPVIPAAIVMEILEGESLSALLKREGKLTKERALSIGQQMLAGLGAAHAKGIVHRDIKPANVFLIRSAPEIVKILDFGVAKSLDAGSYRTTTGVVLGTPAYMAPEQVLAKPVDARTDLFAVGACIFEMLTGTRITGSIVGPEVARAIIELNSARLISKSTLATDYPSIARALDKALANDPANRWLDAESMSNALVAAPLPTAAAAVVAVVAETPTKKKKKKKTENASEARALGIIAALMVTLAGVVGVVLATRGPKNADNPSDAMALRNALSSEPPPPPPSSADGDDAEATSAPASSSKPPAHQAAIANHRYKKCRCVAYERSGKFLTLLDNNAVRECQCITTGGQQPLCAPEMNTADNHCSNLTYPKDAVRLVSGHWVGDTCSGFLTKPDGGHAEATSNGKIRCKTDPTPVRGVQGGSCSGLEIKDGWLVGGGFAIGIFECEAP